MAGSKTTQGGSAFKRRCRGNGPGVAGDGYDRESGHVAGMRLFTYAAINKRYSRK